MMRSLGLLAVMVCVLGLGSAVAGQGTADQKGAFVKDAQPFEVPFVEGQAPPAAEPGWVWCLVTKPATYKSVSEQVVVRPATFYYETTPAVLEEKTEEVMLEPEKKVAVPVPAEYKMETVQKVIKAESTRYEVVPAVYEWADEVVEVKAEGEHHLVEQQKYKTVTEQVLVEPARTEWRKVDCNEKGVIVHKRESKDDCYTMCEIPARYATVTRQVLDQDVKAGPQKEAALTKTIKVQKLVKDAEVKKIVEPAQYETIQRQVMVKPSGVRYETIPAKYGTIVKKVVKTPEGKVKVDLPAKYETVCKDVMEQPASMVWRKRRLEMSAPAAPKAPRREIPGIASTEVEFVR